MFRIERDLVLLGATRTIKAIQVDIKSLGDYESNNTTEAGVAGENQDAAASATTVTTAAVKLRSSAEIEAEAKARKIVGNAVTEAETKAHEILNAAEEEASKMMADAENEAEEVTRDAKEKAAEERGRAKQEGFAEGEKAGKHSYDERLEARLSELNEEYGSKRREDDEKLRRVIEELYEERTRAFDRLEEEIVKLSLEIVKKVVNPPPDEAGGEGGAFEMLIRNALRQINPDGKVLIRVSPAEYERFFSSGSAVFAMDAGVTLTASILRDASLKAGDCVIDTEEETVNAGLDSQLKYIQLAFDRADAV